MSIIIGNKSLNDWGYVTSFDLGTPEIDKKKQEIPGRNGAIDYTETLTGYANFKNREIIIQMSIINRETKEFRRIMSEIRNFCHGEKKKIIFPDDDSYYYIGRCSVSEQRINHARGDIEIRIDAEPYALKNSVTEVIGSGILELNNESMPTIMSIECSVATNIIWGHDSYNLEPGESIIDKILPPGITEIEVNNEVTIRYQEGKI